MAWGMHHYDRGRYEPPKSCEEKIRNADAILVVFGSLVILGLIWISVLLAQLVSSGQVVCIPAVADMTEMVLAECKKNLDLVVTMLFFFCVLFVVVLLLCRAKLYEKIEKE